MDRYHQQNGQTKQGKFIWKAEMEHLLNYFLYCVNIIIIKNTSSLETGMILHCFQLHSPQNEKLLVLSVHGLLIPPLPEPFVSFYLLSQADVLWVLSAILWLSMIRTDCQTNTNMSVSFMTWLSVKHSNKKMKLKLVVRFICIFFYVTMTNV